MLEEIMKPILGEYGELGFELSEANNHDLELKYRGQIVAMTVGLGIHDEDNWKKQFKIRAEST